MKSNRAKKFNELPCPSCMKVGKVRPIIYGMPDPDSFDFENHAVGGCCVSEDGLDPENRCSACNWEGFPSQL